MAIAISGGPMEWTEFPGQNRAAIVSGIYFVLRRAGWAATPITGGYKLTATSPQSGTLAVSVSVWDPGSGVQAFVQFSGAGGTGLLHKLLATSGRTYQIVAYPSEFWVSVPGLASDPNGSVVCGGIPFLPPSSLIPDPGCSGAGAVTECWWSSGDDYGGTFFAAATPRECMDGVNSGDNVPARNSGGMFNGAYTSDPTQSMVDHGSVRIATVAPCYSSQRGGTGIPHVRYPDESPLLVDPLICWGDAVDQPLKVRGQNWNAQIVSEPHPMDDTSTAFGATQLDPRFNWVNFTNNYFFGSLYLAVPSKTALKPKTYVY